MKKSRIEQKKKPSENPTHSTTVSALHGKKITKSSPIYYPENIALRFPATKDAADKYIPSELNRTCIQRPA